MVLLLHAYIWVCTIINVNVNMEILEVAADDTEELFPKNL